MDALALLLDKGHYCGNLEVPVKKNWVNLAEYFEVPEDERLRCQRCSQNSPSKNMFIFLKTSRESLPLTKVRDCLSQVGRADLAIILEPHVASGESRII